MNGTNITMVSNGKCITFGTVNNTDINIGIMSGTGFRNGTGITIAIRNGYFITIILSFFKL